MLLILALTYVNAGIVRAAESSSYVLETYGDSMMNGSTGVSAGYSLQGSVDWNHKTLTSTNYQIVSDGGTTASTNSSTGGSSGGSDAVSGGGGSPGSRGDRAGPFSFTLPVEALHPSADEGLESSEPATVVPAPEAALQTASVRTVSVRTQPILAAPHTQPFVRSPISETFSTSPDIPCLSKTTSIGCLTVAEGVVLSRLSLLYRAEQVISSVPAFQIMRGSTFTSSLIGMRAGSITIEALLFPFGFLFRKRKKREPL